MNASNTYNRLIDENKGNFTDFESRVNSQPKRKISRSPDEPVKKIALDKLGQPEPFKVPGKPSKKETLKPGEFIIIPASSLHIEACYMALYLQKLSMRNVSDYKKILLTFNKSLTFLPKLSVIKKFIKADFPTLLKKFSFYNSHLLNSMEESLKINNITTAQLPSKLPNNVQEYMYEPNKDGISMIQRFFPNPGHQRIRILRTITDSQIFYSVILKNKDFESLI